MAGTVCDFLFKQGHYTPLPRPVETSRPIIIFATSIYNLLTMEKGHIKKMISLASLEMQHKPQSCRG